MNVGESLIKLCQDSGIYALFSDPKPLIMIAIACVLMYLAVVKKYEPLLLMPIAFGMLLTNLPIAGMYNQELFAGGHTNWSLFGGAVGFFGADQPGCLHLYRSGRRDGRSRKHAGTNRGCHHRWRRV